MTAPASDPGRPDSVNRHPTPRGEGDSAGGSSVKKPLPEVHDEPTSITKLPQLQANQTDETPTIISGNRHRAQGPDSQLAESLAGRKLGHFELIESVGVGGMAAVIKARDLDLARIVALKILPPDMAVDPENVTRFKQEARAAAKLDHENIARVYFCGEDQGLHFIAFEFVEGETLRHLMERRGGMLPVRDAVSYLIQVTAGLVHAASRAVVHRDIKPSNIIITPDGKAKIVDMGLARNLDAHSVNGGVTQSGVTLGTFDYISPEQAIEPRSADTRSDIYSLGCTFYHALTGVVPVPEGTAAKKLHAHQHLAPVDPRVLNPVIPDELAAILGKMMAKEPMQRYQTPEHLLHHLLSLAEHLQLDAGSARRTVSNSTLIQIETALPKPPGFSPLWIGATLIALLVCVVAFSGGLSGPDRDPIDQQPLWPNEREAAANNKKEQVLPNPPVVTEIAAKNEPKVAKDAAELVALLTQNNARIQLLEGKVYDLTKSNGTDPAPEALFQGKELLLQGTNPRRPSVIKLNALPADDGKTPRNGSLTLRGNPENGASTATIKNVHFQIQRDMTAEATQPVGVSVRGMSGVEFDGCVFEPSGDLTESEMPYASVGISVGSGMVKGLVPELTIQNSYFARGHVGVRSLGRNRVKLFECAAAPQSTLIEMKAGAVADTTGDRTPATVRLEHCSVFLQTGSVIEIAERFPCTIQAGFNLFSVPDGVDEGQPVVVKQIGERAAEFKFEARLSGTAAPNGYHHVLAYRDTQAYTPAECKQNKIAYTEPQPRNLYESWTQVRGGAADWAAESLEEVQKAFQPSIDNRQLRVSDRRALLGVNGFLGVRFYSEQELVKLKDEPRLGEKQRAWEPGATASPLPPGVYRTLQEALVNHQKGDTILLRFSGERKIDPVLFSKIDTELTLKADVGFKPVLSLNESTEAVMFNLKSGKLTLDGIQFRLAPWVRSLAALPRGGECNLNNCVVTLEDESVASSVVTLTDSAGDTMMMPLTPEAPKPSAPRVSLANSFVRGKGKLLSVKASRAFDFEAKNSLVVLDGSLIDIDPSAADLAQSVPATVKMHQVTAYFTGNLIDMEANAKQAEGKGLGLVKLNCQMTNCVLVPASTATPMVLLEHLETEAQVREVFAWDGGKNNLYKFGPRQELLRYQSENAEGTMPKRYDRDEWLTLTSESAKSFSAFQFAVKPPEAGQSFARRGKNDFAVRADESLPKLEEGASYGAPLGGVPNAE